MQPLVRLENVDVALNGKAVLRGINWELMPRENWAIVGRNGSGKSTLLRLVRGELWPAPGEGKRTYFLDGREQQDTAIGVREKISAVTPELQERYLQQAWRFSARQVILSGFANTEYLYFEPMPAQRARADAVADLLGIEKLLRRNVQQLSTGELRKVLVARALISAPPVLILDEVCDGLDVRSREILLVAIERVAQSGTQILYATHRVEELSAAVTNRLELEDGRIACCGPIAASKRVPRHQRLVPRSRNRIGRVLIQVRDTDVYLDRKRVLHRINWQIRENEHWAVLGANGAGKSTFLKLLGGDLHPAAGGRVQRWNFTAKNTLWDIRRRIGFLSPELQANYRDSLSAQDVIASGFFSSIGLRQKPNSNQRRKVRKLMTDFGVSQLADKRVGQMSYGEFRKILLLRALVHSPELLLCDEPFDGLDAEARRDFRDALENAARAGIQLLIVTHHVDELPACISHTLLLENGRIARHR
jgi:molybdate transport system ATP-binding protein